ncbi:FHA domain-containing protein [Gordonia liuliyuniae]|uniref:ATP-binding cassette domain-containing protein n=1 Tax=Gordonia liuliyuniae TaxID=2911517 RepID=A0ABS9IQ53_9ACTN|nr:FHA domain-containing protein [Gordonia liuliyuniae]MCF8587691.1 ATP-binding cassette domain-containing protein [Gordonia liuliyuniae]
MSSPPPSPPLITPLTVQVAQTRPQILRSAPASLGRTPENDVVVNHPLVSRTHLAFEFVDGAWWIVDRGSTNGFYVDGVRSQSVRVDRPLRIRLGDGGTGPLVDVVNQANDGGQLSGGNRPNRVDQQPARPPHTPAPPASGTPPVQVQQSVQGQLPVQNHRPGQAPRTAPTPAQAPPGGYRQAPPRFGALPDAPHLAALHQNASAVYEVPGDLRGREQIPVSGVKTIGRTPDNDIVVSDVLASRHHARLTSTAQGLLLDDLRSVNGTFVNGHRVASQRLSENDVVTIGNSDFVVAHGTLTRGRPQAQVSGGLDVSGIGFTVDDKTLLNDISFNAAPGTLTAIIGPSGAGKSTVSKIAAGLTSPTVGVVDFEGRNVHSEYEALRSRIGMVPQDDVLHHKLTLRQALRYAAELRLPKDLSTADRDEVIDGVLSELQLAEHVDTRVDKLSGGQRKRASVAMELLTGPSLLILDEPTSGLDPALDQQVMRTLRRLADAGRVVLVVTHSLTYLSLCDQVLLLAPGGKTAFCGAPGDVAAEMGTTDWAEIFAQVAEQPDRAWARYRTRHPHSAPPPARAPSGQPPKAVHASIVRQLSTIGRRQVRLILADRGYLAVLVLMPVVLGLLVLVVPGDKGFTRPDMKGPAPSDVGEALQILTVLVIGAAFMGTALAVRDLVAERSIFERERAVGLRPAAYLAAKVAVFCVVATLQTAVMVGLTYGLRAMPTADASTEPGTVYPMLPPAVTLFLAVATVAWVGVLVGLAISAAVRSSEQTMPPLVIVIMVQLVLSGGVIAISSAVVQPFTWLLPTYWAFANAAQAVNVPYIAPDVSQVNPVDRTVRDDPIMYPLWEPSTIHAAISYGALAAIGVVLAAFVYWRLRLRKH